MTQPSTLQQRIDRAMQLRAKGYNCSQCVAMVFPEITGLTPEQMSALSAGLGGGVGGQQQVCGTVCAMSMVLGCAGYSAPADKPRLYRTIRQCSDQFAATTGSIVCGELLAATGGLRTRCADFIKLSIEIVHNHIQSSQQ